MSDTRVDLVNSLISSTESGKLKWEVGARSDQYYATVPSGSVVISKQSKAYTNWNPSLVTNVPRPTSGGAVAYSELSQEDVTSGYSGGVPAYSEVTNDTETFDYFYALEIRDKSANIIDTITSEMWKWLPAFLENGIEKLYNLAQKSIRDAKDEQLGKIIKDLNAL